jgi:diacylglycerol kinase (ATP)
MNQKHVIIAYNPKSGSFDQRLLDRLNDAFVAAGHICIFVDSHSDELLQMAAVASHICVVGGDGSLRDVAARLRGARDLPPISVYPAGTINLVARELSYPRNIQKFVTRVVGSDAPRKLYLGEINEQPVLVCASIGPDSLAVAAVSEDLKRRIGRFAYAVALGKLLLQWPRHSLSVQTDDASFKCEAAFVLNGRYFAGHWQLSRIAEMSAPVFQLLLLPSARRRDYLRLILSVAVVPAMASKRWIRVSSTSAEIQADSPLPVQIDGDIAAKLPVKVTVNMHPMLFA